MVQRSCNGVNGLHINALLGVVNLRDFSDFPVLYNSTNILTKVFLKSFGLKT